MDQGGTDAKTSKHLVEETKGIEIGILVNNVGMSYRYPRYFHELKDEEIDQLVQLIF